LKRNFLKISLEMLSLGQKSFKKEDLIVDRFAVISRAGQKVGE